MEFHKTICNEKKGTAVQIEHAISIHDQFPDTIIENYAEKYRALSFHIKTTSQ